MKTAFIVGGNLYNNKKSSVIDKLGDNFKEDFCVEIFNGVLCENISYSDLTLWMIDVDNSVGKNYPQKKFGSVLICSKVIRDNRTRFDAVSRIFNMNGNAVICIYKDSTVFEFELVDALGNTWGERTSSISKLYEFIIEFYEWSCSQIRYSANKMTVEDELININKYLSTKVQNSIGSRYFGNVSTRCMKLFPSLRYSDDVFLVSARNSNKEFLTKDDFVPIVLLEDGELLYSGERKPSVDTSIQIALYENFQNINYFIHGHAFIDGAKFTSDYYPCGDVREYHSIVNILKDDSLNSFEINLLKHGFLIGSNNLSDLKTVVENLKITQKEILA